MSILSIDLLGQGTKKLLVSFGSAVIFYTVIPLPPSWTGEWSRIARWSPIIGLIIGGILGILIYSLHFCGIPVLTRSVIVIAIWLSATGSLHLDGAMDTADGLSVTNPERRLEVMRDSVTGAFGAIAAIIILLLKTVAIAEMQLASWLALMMAAGWGRWGQVMAIACYPYLRETGKGAFHKANMRLPQDILLGSIVLLGFSSLLWWLQLVVWWQVVLLVLGNSAIALLSGYYFYLRLGGHTGDTYGAVVEWTEALILCWLTAFK